MTRRTDPVDEALRLLREDTRVALPDPALEARLRSRHRPVRHGRSWRRLAAAALVFTVAGAAFAASGGVERLRSWWYRITVDGATESGVIEGDGERSFEYTADDGTRIQVHVTRRTGGGGTETAIRVRQEDASRLQLDEERYQEGPADTRVQLPVEVLGAQPPLHRWLDPERGWLALHLVNGERVGVEGTAILVQECDSDRDRPVLLQGTLRAHVDDIDTISITEDENGLVELTLRDRGSFEYALSLLPSGSTGKPPGFESPDGRVRVQVDD